MSAAAMQGTAQAQSATGASARGSSFYAAMRIMPRAQRSAIFEVYDFARRVDDIADDGGTRDERLAGLAASRAEIAAIYAGETPPALAGLAQAIRAFGLQQADFDALIDGMAMDAEADIHAPDAATFDLYLDRVASAVGRHVVRICGLPEADGQALAHELGRAVQIANILRDIDEDAARGRLYLPREALIAAGIPPDAEPVAIAAHDGISGVAHTLAQHAATRFAAADAIMARHPRRITRTPRIMAEAYKMLLTRQVTLGWVAPRSRARLGKLRALRVLARHYF